MNLSASSRLRWLFLDLNSFFASCEQQENPKLRGKPIGIVPLMAETTCCLAASYPAKAFGIKTGTAVWDARARCPEIQFVLANHATYTRYHHKILEVVDRYIPIDKVLSIDEMICELTGSQRNPEVAILLAKQIKAGIEKHVGACLTSSVGLAPNRFLAKVGSDMQKPNGLTLLNKGDLPQSLFRLQPRDLPGIGAQMELRLHKQGIHTMKQLCHLSQDDMRALWGGVVGERFYLWLRGEDTPEPEHHHYSMGHQHVLEPALRHAEGAWAVGKKLLVKAAVRLRKEGFFTKRLFAQIKFLGDLYWAQEIRFEETQDTLKLLTALRSLWPKYPSRDKPFRVGITFVDLIPKTRHQLPLFGNPRREFLGEAMDKINTRYGKETLSLGSLYQYKSAAPTRISFTRIPDAAEF